MFSTCLKGSCSKLSIHRYLSKKGASIKKYGLICYKRATTMSLSVLLACQQLPASKKNHKFNFSTHRPGHPKCSKSVFTTWMK